MAGSRIPGPTGVVQGELIDDGTLCRIATPLPGPVGAAAHGNWPSIDGSGAGVDIILTPLQLAAVLDQESLSTESATSNRWWGAVSVLAGALELVGAGALLAVPEPTLVTKAAGGALGAHGIDTASTGVKQVLSGRSESTLTAQSMQAAAEGLGVDPKTAVLLCWWAWWPMWRCLCSPGSWVPPASSPCDVARFRCWPKIALAATR